MPDLFLDFRRYGSKVRGSSSFPGSCSTPPTATNCWTGAPRRWWSTSATDGDATTPDDARWCAVPALPDTGGRRSPVPVRVHGDPRPPGVQRGCPASLISWWAGPVRRVRPGVCGAGTGPARAGGRRRQTVPAL